MIRNNKGAKEENYLNEELKNTYIHIEDKRDKILEQKIRKIIIIKRIKITRKIVVLTKEITFWKITTILTSSIFKET